MLESFIYLSSTQISYCFINIYRKFDSYNWKFFEQKTNWNEKHDRHEFQLTPLYGQCIQWIYSIKIAQSTWMKLFRQLKKKTTTKTRGSWRTSRLIDYFWYEWNCVNRFTNQLQHKIIAVIFIHLFMCMVFFLVLR